MKTRRSNRSRNSFRSQFENLEARRLLSAAAAAGVDVLTYHNNDSRTAANLNEKTLTTQNACDTRSDCTSVFEGDDCTCYPGGYCECAILTWDHCETVGGVPMPL